MTEPSVSTTKQLKTARNLPVFVSNRIARLIGTTNCVFLWPRLSTTPIAIHMLSMHAHKTSRVLADKGHQRMHAADRSRYQYCSWYERVSWKWKLRTGKKGFQDLQAKAVSQASVSLCTIKVKESWGKGRKWPSDEPKVKVHYYYAQGMYSSSSS